MTTPVAIVGDVTSRTNLVNTTGMYNFLCLNDEGDTTNGATSNNRATTPPTSFHATGERIFDESPQVPDNTSAPVFNAPRYDNNNSLYISSGTFSAPRRNNNNARGDYTNNHQNITTNHNSNNYNRPLCADPYPLTFPAVGAQPANNPNCVWGVGPKDTPVYLKADEKKAILEMLPQVNKNDLRQSLKKFELALDMHGAYEDRDKRELALRYFPEYIADAFFEKAGVGSTYIDLKEIIISNSQQLFACHNIQPVETHTWNPFHIFRQTDHILACPKEEWQKEIMIQLSPPMVQNELRLNIDLNLPDFKNRYKAIYNAFWQQERGNRPTQGQINDNRPKFQNNQRPPFYPQQPQRVAQNNAGLCSFHRKYGREAYSCSGMNCAMYPPTGIRPDRRNNTQGNANGGR